MYPNFITIYGASENQIFYNTRVAEVRKEILTRNGREKHIPSPYYMSNVFRGGSEECLT